MPVSSILDFDPAPLLYPTPRHDHDPNFDSTPDFVLGLIVDFHPGVDFQIYFSSCGFVDKHKGQAGSRVSFGLHTVCMFQKQRFNPDHERFDRRDLNLDEIKSNTQCLEEHAKLSVTDVLTSSMVKVITSV
ncbi:hypothetical protein EVAR_40184_1 [Eumeta japonica]|uniref:Uncharacterized protein n=1 Tax=Eumeta variegata TaxID=151549 RepID=A0A4C1XLB0_EUMVA|nr:hypothetical protein EVAR_40184_1 [Eumeta japonica]